MKWIAVLPALLKSVGAGVVIGALALLSQCPTDVSAFMLPDDYSINGEQHASSFFALYIAHAKTLEDDGFSVDHACPALRDVYEQVQRHRKTIEDVAPHAMIALESFSSSESISERLVKLRERLKDRRGDRVIVVSSHRHPPKTPKMRSVWPLPSTISAEWLCANPNAANEDPGVKEVRILSVLVSSDALVNPLVRVTGESPSSPPISKLIWKLRPAADPRSPASAEGVLDAPVAGTNSSGFQSGVSPKASGSRFAWQFALPRFSTHQWLSIELSDANSKITHPWRTPIELYPNQIRIRAGSEEAANRIKELPGFGAATFPFVLVSEPAVSGASMAGEVTAQMPPLDANSLDDAPVLELVPISESGTTGRVVLTAAYEASVLGAVTIRPGLREAWPVLTSPVPMTTEEVFASVRTVDEKMTPLLYRRDPERFPSWFTLHVPTAELRTSMNKDAALGHRHLAFFAASLADRLRVTARTESGKVKRDGDGRNAWLQRYFVSDEEGTLPLSTGHKLESGPLLEELLRSLCGGSGMSKVRETPGNSATAQIAPIIPWGLLMVIAVTGPSALAAAITARRNSKVRTKKA